MNYQIDTDELDSGQVVFQLWKPEGGLLSIHATYEQAASTREVMIRVNREANPKGKR